MLLIAEGITPFHLEPSGLINHKSQAVAVVHTPVYCQ